MTDLSIKPNDNALSMKMSEPSNYHQTIPTENKKRKTKNLALTRLRPKLCKLSPSTNAPPKCAGGNFCFPFGYSSALSILNHVEYIQKLTTLVVSL